MKLKLHLTIIALVLAGCTSHHEQLYKEKSGFYSYIIGDARSDNVEKEHASEVYATPASCQKVATSLVALKTLGPEYRYKTELSTKKKGKVIQDVIIKFSGDPTLSSEQLVALLRPLQNSKINGHITLDTSAFKTPPYSPNLIIDDIGTEYATPVSAINIDKNLIIVKVLPNKKIGKFAEVHVNEGYKTDSAVIASDDHSSVKLSWKNDVIQAKGNINQQDDLLELKISPVNQEQYIRSKIRSVLNALNIKIKGRIQIIYNKSHTPSEFKVVNTIQSETLKEIIPPALKSSNNLVFDAIYLTIINNNSEEEITDWAQGNIIIKELINKHFSVNMKDSLFVDGSGLSRYNRIQPKLMFSLLKKGFDVTEFVESLPKPGEEKSTLQKRTTLPNYIRAKTGGMSGISCLCGYSFKSPKHPKAFVFMANSFAPPSKELWEVMDNFIKTEM